MIHVEKKVVKEEEEFKMKLEIKENENSLQINLKKNSNLLANSIRRIILDEVPTFAIEDVEIVSNLTPLYDETIAQRLGLIPIKTDLKSYNFRKTCKCGGLGCALCEVKMAIKFDESGFIYSSSIKSDDPKIVPSDLQIPITKNFNEKAFEINMKAVLGIGKEHAKWAPAHTYLREENEDVNLIIEGFGQLDNKEIFNKALDILIEKTKELEEKI